MNAREQVERVAAELRRRNMQVEVDPYSTSTLAAIHNPYLDGPFAYLLVVTEDGRSGWRAAERTATDEYSTFPSRMDDLPPNAEPGRVVDYIQACIEGQLMSGIEPTAAIEELRSKATSSFTLIVLRGEAAATDAIARHYSQIFADRFNRTICFDVAPYQERHGVNIRRLLSDYLVGLGKELPDLPQDDDWYARALYDRYREAIAEFGDVLIHVHNVTEPAQARWLYPLSAGSALLVTTRSMLASLRLDDAHFLDVKPPHRKAIND